MQLIEDALFSDPSRAASDLGPLAWVLEELRKSLDSTGKALRRFARDAASARAAGLPAPATAALHAVPQQLHQSVGALEMVEMSGPAILLRAMETTAQAFVRRPDLCTENAAAQIERAGAALVEYLETVLAGKSVSAVTLFPQYREITELAEGEKAHPADLWTMQWRWAEPRLSPLEARLKYEPVVRSRLDQAVLKIVKSPDAQAAREVSRLSLGLAAGQTAQRPSIFWQISAAFFEALAHGLLPTDLYVKRLASRILMQYSALSRGDEDVSKTLVRDLLFYCAHIKATATATPVLSAVRDAFGLSRFAPVDYETRRFGRFDPALLANTRKRIHAAAETWSAIAGGDVSKLRLAGEHFHLLADAMVRLQPESAELAQALREAVGDAMRSGRPPAPGLAMEVATSVLYLQAAYEDLDQTDARLAERAARLVQRLELVRAGGQPEPLETWMEELYGRVSDRQTMGSVVEEMRANLLTVEKSLDQFFRDTSDRSVLAGVSSQLSQMRGVLSVLGLDQASHAVVHMRDSIDRFVSHGTGAQMAGGVVFEKLGNSLGALGFLVDMLSYQPALAKKLFVFDAAVGELRPVMGRSVLASELPGETPAHPSAAAIARQAEPAAPAPAAALSAPQAEAVETVDPELLDIFLEEAREVVVNGLASIDALRAHATDSGEQTALRRAFHTLKGSSRMVGLASFGEAAWSMEQLHNAWLADQKPADSSLLTLSQSAMQGFGRWAEAIAQGGEIPFHARDFQHAADALRLEGRLVDIAPAQPALPTVAPAVSDEPLASEPVVDDVVPQETDAGQSADAGIEMGEVGFSEFAALSDLGAVPTPQEPPQPESLQPSRDEELQAEPTAETQPPIESTPDELVAPEAEAALPVAGDGADETEMMALHDSGAPELDLEFEKVEAASIEPEAQVDQAEPIEPFAAAEIAQPSPEAAAEQVSAEETPTDEAPTKEAPTEQVAAEEMAEQQTPAEEVPAESLEAAADFVAFEPDSQPDEAYKVIGDLRVGIPLYSVYLGEADIWSRQLLNDLAEWALDAAQPVPESAIAMAHSLSGSSSTVGFSALSMLARKLERALDHAQMLGYGNEEHAPAFLAAADDVSRLLHQFAAGFLKDAKPEVLDALEDVLNTETHSVMSPDSDAEEAADTLEATAANAVKPARGAIFEPARTVLPEAPAFAALNLDDDIDAVDNIDADLFPIFEEEARELMPQLGSALRQWGMRPDNEGARAEVMRVLHTLKGSARLAGALRLGEMAHRMESDIAAFGSDESPLTAQVEPLLGQFDGLQKHLDLLRHGGAAVEEMQAIAQPSDRPAEIAAETAEPALAREAVRPAAVTRPTKSRASVRLGSHSVRVRTQLLDRLVNQAGEIMMTRSRLESRVAQLRDSLSDLTGNLDRLRQQLRDVELQAETQMQSRLAQSKDSGAGFDPLEFDRFTRVQELTRMMAESVNDVATVQRTVQRSVEGAEDDLVAQARQSRELQRDLLRTRMVEFEGISERLYAVVRQAAKDTGKQVRLDITGGTIEMDRGMLDRMTPAFEHLLRNAVAHGIESAEDRAAAGKPASGTITIDLHHAGNDVSVQFRDDGAGLDIDQIRQKAQQRDLVGAGQSLTDAEAAQLIFKQGFSTASVVTELAGRGIGLDVVRAELDALGGRIETDSHRGQGTSFTMVLPLTTAVTQIVMLRAGEQTLGVPAAVVELVRRVPNEELDSAYASGSFRYAGETLPFYWCGALLQSSAKSVEQVGKNRFVLIIRSAAQRLALHVDEVLGNQEVVVKNLGPQLARLPGLAGMSVLASGAVAMIYNPVALATVYGPQARQWAQEQASAAADGCSPAGVQTAVAEARQAPLVLVVDDSITVRRVTQRLLEREGYRVALAADGLQAIERLHEELPVMVLSDIEMPRMDGFDLARNIRGDASTAHLPIVMITSRIGDKHREHALELGVQHYLGKPYSEEELLRLVRHYVRARASVTLH